MPGRLIDLRHTPTAKKGMATSNEQHVPPSASMANGTGPGVREAAPVRMEPAVKSPSTSTTTDPKASLEDKMKDLPPELREITEGYAPLARLFERSAQDTSNALNDMLADLEALTDQERPQANGDYGHQKRQPEQDAKKRLRWLDFANSHRERFMKMFVMLKWAESSREPIGKLIDLRDWLIQGVMADQQVQEGLMWNGKEAIATAIASPDLESALRLLSSHQSERMPDLDYLPKKPLSAQVISDELERINTLLHVRLNLHETLPKQLRNYSIASGRVTFTIERSFEMDLSILGEDPTSKFFFIDFRYLFSPSSEIPTGQMRLQIEYSLTNILATEGLVACYEYLHDYVLTYKLSILRRQALELTRRSWNGNLRVERIHRSLILHYWTQKTRKKSWIEISVQSGKASGITSPNGRPQLVTRWFRHGQAVPIEETPELDDQELDLAPLLQHVVTEHVNSLLLTTVDQLKQRLATDVQPRPRILKDGQDEVWMLSLPLYSIPSAQVRINPTTGRFAISPVSTISLQTTTILDALKDPESELVDRLLDWRLHDARSLLEETSTQQSWEIARYKNLDAITKRKLFGGDAQAHPVFMRRWHITTWAVAACPVSNGYTFWLLESSKAKQPSSREIDGFLIQSSQQIRLSAVSLHDQAPTPSKRATQDDHSLAKSLESTFDALRETSIAAIAASTINLQLTAAQLPFRPTAIADHQSLPWSGFTPLEVQLPSMHHALSRQAILFLRKPLASDHNQVNFLVTLKLDESASLSALRAAIHSAGVSISPEGDVCLIDKAPLGSSDLINRIVSRISKICQIYANVETFDKQGLRLLDGGDLSFETESAFYYGGGPHPLAVKLNHATPQGPRLTFEPDANPHRRMQSVLMASLGQSQPSSSSLATISSNLLNSLSLMEALETIEHGKPFVDIHVHDLDHISVHHIHPRCAVHIRHRPFENESWWYISHEQARNPNGPQAGQPLNAKLNYSLKEIYSQQDTEQMKCLKSAIAATAQAVKHILIRIDEVVRSCADGEPSPSTSRASNLSSKPSPRVPENQQGQQTQQANGIPVQQQPNGQLPAQQPQIPRTIGLMPVLPQPHNHNLKAPPMAQSRSHGQLPQQTQAQVAQSQPMTASRSQGPAPRSGNATPNGRPAQLQAQPNYQPQPNHQIQQNHQMQAQPRPNGQDGMQAGAKRPGGPGAQQDGQRKVQKTSANANANTNANGNAANKTRPQDVIEID